LKFIGDDVEKQKQRKSQLEEDIQCLKKKVALAEAILCEEFKSSSSSINNNNNNNNHNHNNYIISH